MTGRDARVAAVTGAAWHIGVALSLAAGVTSAASAQLVHGSVADSASGSPVAGALVTLEAPDGRRVGVVATGSDGRYRVAAPAAGTFRLAVDRIGHARWISTPFAVRGADSVRRDVRLAGRRVRLDAVVVTGTSHCRASPAEAPELVGAWEEIRRALTLSDLGERDRATTFELRLASRIMTGRGEVAGYTRRSRLRDRAVHPWTAPAPSALAERGYVERSGDSLLHHGPSVATLLSDEFVATHCFSLVRDGERDGERVGIAFAPRPRRDVADIAGTIWLDAATSELGLVEFAFTGVADSLGDGRPPHGTLEFDRLPAGRWFIRRWSLRVPLVALSVADAGDPDAAWERRRRSRARSRIDEPFRESIGEAVVLPPSERAVAATDVATVTGVVVDSTIGEPLAGVRVLAPNALVAETDASGRYVLEVSDVPDSPTDHVVTFVHPSFVELGLASTSRAATLRAGTTTRLDFGVPSIATLLRGSCPLDGVAPTDASGALHAGMIVGEVQLPDGSAPDEPMTVEAEWPDDAPAAPAAAGGDAALLQLRATSVRADGGFHLCPLPLGREVVLRAMRDGAAVASTRIVLPGTGLARYTLVVEPEGAG